MVTRDNCKTAHCGLSASGLACSSVTKRVKGLSENLQYPYFCEILIEFVNKKDREKDLEKEIDNALKHEENVQHDENEKPITFAEKTNEK